MEAAAAVAARETEAATRHPWCGRSLGGIVSPAGLGFCRAALDDTLGPSFLDTAGDAATLAGDWSHLCTVDTLAKRLRHWLPDMRRSAAESLGDLARASDGHIVKALSEALREEGDAEARLAMAEALGKLAHRGADALGLRTAAVGILAEARQGHHDPEVRRAAVEAHGLVGRSLHGLRGHLDSLAELAPSLRDEGPAVRAAAVAQVASLAGLDGSPAAIAMATQLLQDPERIVRDAAVGAIEEITALGAGEAAMDAMRASLDPVLQGGNAGACLATVQAVQRSAMLNDPVAVHICLDCADHADADVRLAVVGCLESRTKPGTWIASATIALRLRDEITEVRMRAAEACVARAAALDAVALAAVVAGCKAQEDDDLLRGLGQEAWPGIADAVEAEASLEDTMASAQAALLVIKKQEWVKRRAAARILGEAIAERGAGSVNVVPLKDRMKDEEKDFNNRMALEAAAKYLQKPLAEGADGPAAIYLLVELLRDGHPSVVKGAIGACGRILARARDAAAQFHAAISTQAEEVPAPAAGVTARSRRSSSFPASPMSQPAGRTPSRGQGRGRRR